MSIELVTTTRLAQFAARFEAQADGALIYFHPDGRAGLPCTQAEAAQFIAEFAESHHQSARRLVYWVIATGLVIGVLEASGTLVLARWAQYSIFLLPVLFTLHDWRRANLSPLRLLEGRIPVAAPRTAARATQSRLAALPVSLIVMMLLPAAGLVYYAMQTGWEISHALIVGCDLLLAVAWLLARWRRRG